MSNTNTLDKDRLYFTQCNEEFSLRCPACTKFNKTLRQCKIFKKFPAIWCHLKRDHTDVTQTELEEFATILNYIFKGFKRQMFTNTIPTITRIRSGSIIAVRFATVVSTCSL